VTAARAFTTLFHKIVGSSVRCGVAGWVGVDTMTTLPAVQEVPGREQCYVNRVSLRRSLGATIERGSRVWLQAVAEDAAVTTTAAWRTDVPDSAAPWTSIS
jgi:hypothetical protein